MRAHLDLKQWLSWALYSQPMHSDDKVEETMSLPSLRRGPRVSVCTPVDRSLTLPPLPCFVLFLEVSRGLLLFNYSVVFQQLLEA